MQIKYTAEATAARFHADNSFVRGIMGPIGSGKSVACCMEIFSRAIRQTVGSDGKRSSRWAVIRNTYPELKSTTIRTWSDWFPESICPVKWDTPITATMKLPDIGDGTGLDLELIFLALDKPQDIKKLLSLELTGAWINEAKEVSLSVLDMLTGRVGRFPSKRDGGWNWSGIIMDTNPPDDDHWWYSLAEELKPQGYSFYKQPPALILKDGEYIPNPLAENIRNHQNGYDYYLRQVPGKDRQWIKVFVQGEYGSWQEGKLVYPEYQDAIHCSETPLDPYEGVPLILGWDYGLTPCVAICQMTPRGQFRVIDELVTDDMGVRQFANDIVKPYLLNNYGKFRIESYGDPAGNARSSNSERTCMMELKDAGIPTVAAKTNDFLARREAVAGFMNKMIDGAPGFLVSPKCRHLRKGFLGGYHFKRVLVSGEARYKDMPDKNIYSHIQDALQYAALAVETLNVKKRRTVSGISRTYTSPASSAGY